MCTVCGCGSPDQPGHAPGSQHHHHYGLGPAGVGLADFSQARIVRIERDVLSKNDAYARDNREGF
jgi:hydrogenase nickel incorporation protein HypB